jgi:hypothetical protein
MKYVRATRAALWVTIASSLCSSTAFSRSNGITGVSAAGCGGGSCHGASSFSTTVRIEGEASVVRGSINTYTLVLTNMGFLQDSAGFNVAASSGTLGTAAAATQTQLRSGELTHSSRIASMSSGTWRIPFRWTAPATAGTATLSAAGNVTNSNFSAGGDQWNVGSLVVTVTDTMMSTDAGAPPADSATPTLDAAPPADSGAMLPPPDAPIATPDATAPADSGVATPDGGASDGGTSPPMTMTCRCSSGPTSVDPRSLLAASSVLILRMLRRRCVERDLPRSGR